MLLGGAVDLWMLHVGRFLTGVAGGMTAASIPVGYHGYRSFSFSLFMQVFPFFVPTPNTCNKTPVLCNGRRELNPFSITELVMDISYVNGCGCMCVSYVSCVTGLHIRDLPQSSERSSGVLPSDHCCVWSPVPLRPG